MPTIAEIATSLRLEFEGDGAIHVSTAAHPAEAAPDALAMAMEPRYLEALSKGRARAAVVSPGVDWRALGLSAAVFAPRARFAMSGVTQLFQQDDRPPLGVHPTAVVDPDATIGADARIGPFVVVERGARLGDRASVGAHVSIGADAAIGADARIGPGVRIGPRVRIGARLIIHPNACVGVDGFSFVTPEKGSVEAAKESGEDTVAVGVENRIWRRIASIAAVEIGDDVEIGANTTIDRGTVASTRIGSGTKIDNQVQIGHNCQIGENCLLCGQVGMAGSARVGDRVVLGGQVGVADQARIGDDVLVMASSGVTGALPSRGVYGGAPAIARSTFAEMYTHMRRLPRYARELADLKKRFSEGERSG